MNDPSLPQELLDLESRLRAERPDRFGADFRQRILAAVEEELAVPAELPLRPRQARRWIAVAAMVAGALNLSLIAASQSTLKFGRSDDTPTLSAEVRALSALERQNGNEP